MSTLRTRERNSVPAQRPAAPKPNGYRYLYADSEDFPVQYNFLDTLHGFVQCAGEVGKLYQEAEQLESSIAQAASQQALATDAINRFCEGITDDVRKRVEHAPAPDAVAPVASRILENVRETQQQASGAQEAQAHQQQAQSQAALAENRHRIQQALARFFTAHTVAPLASTFTMKMEEGRPVLSSTCTMPGGISAGFLLDEEAAQWPTPLRVQQLIDDADLQLGLKKKFMRKTLAPDVVHASDFVVAAVDLAERRCAIRLLRRDEEPDEAIVIEMTRGDQGLSASIQRIHDSEVGAVSNDTDVENLPKLAALWNALRERSVQALHHRKSLQWVRLDGEDVLEQGLVPDFLDRFVDQFAPLVTEISKRSASKSELSLKIDRSNGRREEIYLRKEELASHLQSLSSDMFNRFRTLDIFP